MTRKAMTVDIHAASRALLGESECGDQFAILSEEGRQLVVVADGLGHGPLAAEAAREAVAFVTAHSAQELPDVLEGCDRELASTRGAAVSVLRIDTAAGSLEYAGVGNVELVALARHPIHPANSPGIVGGRLRKVCSYQYALTNGDLMVLHTDGVSSRFDLRDYRQQDAASAAERILSEHAKPHDDATCVVLRCQAVEGRSFLSER